MGELIKPEAGKQYYLGATKIKVIEASKRRYWRILVGEPDETFGVRNCRTVSEAEWYSQASTDGPQP